MSDWKKLISDAKELLDLGAITDVEFEEAKRKAFAFRDRGTTHPPPVSSMPNFDDMGTRIHSPSSTPTSPPQNFDDMGTMVGSHQTTSGWDNQGAMVGKSEPETIGSYRIVELLGQGGMGSVYKGRHINEQYAQATGDIAIKMIQPYLAGNEEFKSRFIKEAIFGKNLSHPNIASVIDVVDDGGVLALLMDFVEGQELKALIPAGGMPVEEVVRLLRPIASALDYLHEKGIVHRDMKPANVRVKPDGTPVILDFGIAKDTNEADSGMTQTGTAMGTQTYMAPEQMDAKNVTGAADQYALAMMTYQMLSGRLPWEESLSSVRITMAKMTGDFQDLERLEKISTPVGLAVMKGLSYNIEDRFQTCTDFINDIDNASKDNRLSLQKPTAKKEQVDEEIVPKRVQLSKKTGSSKVTEIDANGVAGNALAKTQIDQAPKVMDEPRTVDLHKGSHEPSSSKVTEIDANGVTGNALAKTQIDQAPKVVLDERTTQLMDELAQAATEHAALYKESQEELKKWKILLGLSIVSLFLIGLFAVPLIWHFNKKRKELVQQIQILEQ